MDKSKPLTFMDYWQTPVPELADHPDFSQHALRVVADVTKLTTKQLEKIDIANLNKEIN